MNKPYTSFDLEDFYYKIFKKYNISSMEELEKAVQDGKIPEEELILKLDDLISSDQQKEAEPHDALIPYNSSIAGLQASHDKPQNSISAPNDL